MCVCMCMCMCVFVCVTDLFLTFYSTLSFFLFVPNWPRVLQYTVIPPLLYANTSFTPAIRRNLHVSSTCCHPPSSLIVLSACHPPGSLASGFLASGRLSPTKVLVMPSLTCPPDPVSSRCTSPFPWRLGGEECWISPFLVTYDPVQSHIYRNIPTSA